MDQGRRATWTADNRAFYYVRYPKPPEGQLLTAVNRNPQVMLHRVGEAADRDQFVYEDPAHADSGLGPVLSADGRWLIVHVDLPQNSSRNMLYFEDLSAASRGWRRSRRSQGPLRLRRQPGQPHLPAHHGWSAQGPRHCHRS